MEICPNCGSNSTTNIEGGKYYCGSCREVFSPYVKKPVTLKSEKTIVSGVGSKIFDSNIGKTVCITAANPQETSSGTGLVISQGGYIITNAHVALSGDCVFELLVAKFNGDDSVNKLLLIDYDEDLDLAILKFSASPQTIKAVSLSSVSAAVTGEEVYVLGNAKGLGISITKGIVSAARHKVNNNEYIMIDNAINSGNSGGPAFNSQNECLGIVTSSLAGAVGMSFIIPSSKILQYIKQVSNDYNLNIL